LSLKRDENVECNISEVDENALGRRLGTILRNNDVVPRCPTHQGQLCQTSDKERDAFVTYIIKKMAILQIDTSAISHFVKLRLLFFYFQIKSTLNVRGAATVSVIMDEELQRCTDIIKVSGSNEKFPPLVFFKGKDTRQGKTFERL
jgi:hypothetical protein